MAEQIIAAFQHGKPVKITSMSWREFIQLLDDIGKLGKTQSGRGQS
ncbi:hypothetical protein [Vibrio coralliilyticus]|nr:hypothetical protein [Vibrio coralliilyticus]